MAAGVSHGTTSNSGVLAVSCSGQALHFDAWPACSFGRVT